MAKTGTNQLELARRTSEVGSQLATLGAQHGFDEETVKLIMSTVATACKTLPEQALFLARAQAEGLNPLCQEIYPIRRRTKDGDSWIDKLTFTISYFALISRASQAGYELVSSNAICSNDEYAGWDAVAGQPVRHIIAGGNRGAVIGSYAIWESRQGKRRGWVWSGKEVSPDKNPLKGSIGEHLAMKTAIGRSARMLAPTLMSTLYLAEELGFVEQQGTVPQRVVETEFEQPPAPDIGEARVVGSSRAGDDGGTAPEPTTRDAEDGTASPPPEADAPAATHGLRVEADMADLSKLLARAGQVIKSGDELMSWASGVLGREVDTFRDVSQEELSMLDASMTEKENA